MGGEVDEVAPGAVLHGTYQILRRIGQGGIGVIYAATHARLAGRYAVKVLNTEIPLVGNTLERFRREAEVTSCLRHPHIVQVVDFNKTADGRPYLVMEYLEGVDLRARLVSEGMVPPNRAAVIVDQVCSALAAAHTLGITHRDLKPANLFCVRVPGSDREFVKILDFGMSKMKHAAKITADATLVGTPQYMSPEQALGRTDQVGPAADQFAMAAILFEMLSGEPAFFGTDMAAVLHAIVQGPPPTFSDPRWAEVERIIWRGLAKDGSQRYPDIATFGKAAQDALARL
jgi:eukaryotic-like serine/threonine-protein kinase